MNYSELLQLAKGWGNFISDRIIIWRLRYTYQYLSRTETKIKECVRIIYNIIQSVTEKLSSLPYIENPLHQLWCEGFLRRHVFKKSCRWQVLCVKKCTKVLGVVV